MEKEKKIQFAKALLNHQILFEGYVTSMSVSQDGEPTYEMLGQQFNTPCDVRVTLTVSVKNYTKAPLANIEKKIMIVFVD